MKTILLTACLASLFVMGKVQAQESELIMPQGKFLIGLAELNEEGLIEFDFGKHVGQPMNVTEMVTQTYVVMVPYTETVTKDGREIQVTKMRAEERTRAVPVTRSVVATIKPVELSELKFFTTGGEERTEEAARNHFASRQPVVGIVDGEVNDYFRQVFRDDIMLVMLPKGIGWGRANSGSSKKE